MFLSLNIPTTAMWLNSSVRVTCLSILKPFSPGSSKSNKIISTPELPDSKVSITFRPLFTAVTTCHIRWNDKLPAWKRRKIANRGGKKYSEKAALNFHDRDDNFYN